MNAYAQVFRPRIDLTDHDLVSIQKSTRIASSKHAETSKLKGSSAQDLELDAAMSKSRTFNEYVRTLDDKTQAIFKKLLEDDDFITFIMKNDLNSLYNFEIKELSEVELTTLVKSLEELDLRMHIEHGTHYNPIECLRQGRNLVIGRQMSANFLGSTEQASITLTKQNIDDFRRFASQDLLYVSPCTSQFSTIAMITHNRQSVVNNVCEFMDSLIRCGYTAREKPLKFFVIDDSGDEGRESRYSELNRIRNEYQGRVDLRLVTEAKKKEIIEFLISKLSFKFSQEEKREYVEAALGNKGGPGAQRNWASLLGSAVTLDDDVHPYCGLSFDGKFRFMPVDFFGVMARALAGNNVFAANFSYTGKSGGSELHPITMACHGVKDPFFVPTYCDIKFVENGKPSKIRTIVNEPLYDSNAASGGIQSLATSADLNKIGIPSVTTHRQYLRNEDTWTVKLEELFLQKNNSKKISVLIPGSAVWHDLGDQKINKDMIKRTILCRLAGIVMANLISGHLVGKKYNKISEFMEGLGTHLLKGPSEELISRFFNLNLYLTIEPIQEWINLLEPKPNSSEAAPIQNMIREVFAELKLPLTSTKSRLPNGKVKVSVPRFDYGQIRDILAREFEHYAKVLSVWPSLVKIARENQKEINKIISSTSIDCLHA